MSKGIFMEEGNLIVQFPVPPPELTFSKAGNIETLEVVKLGEIAVAKDIKLATISFESFFPSQNNYYFIQTKNQFEGPNFYIRFLTEKMKSKKPIRFIVGDTAINLLMFIENFEYTYVGGTDDVNFSISLKEYKEIKIKEVKISDYKDTRKKEPTTITRPPATKKQVTKNCNVILNGRVHRDSWGKGPGKTFKNYKGKVNFIEKKNKYCYHVTTPSGGWLGWVLPECIEVI